jgi:23S rRNA U2552 (ribose-2'-O)-methylase RlmE/FtsJ
MEDVDTCARRAYERIGRAVTALKEMIGTRTAVWDVAKGLSNPYELVFTAPPCVQGVTRGDKRHPQGRAFFKLWEVLRDDPILASDRPILCGFLCEAPGSFVEAIVTLRKKAGARPGDRYVAMSLVDPTRADVPQWRVGQDWCAANNVEIVSGQDGTGDVIKVENQRSFLSDAGGAFDVMTADGGFDFSADFSSQERVMLPLLGAEMHTIMSGLADGGSAVVKLFDVHLPETEALVASFAACFRTARLVKPVTSRPANSERYLVCSGFRRGGGDGDGATSPCPPRMPTEFHLANLVHAARQAESLSRTMLVADAMLRDPMWRSRYFPARAAPTCDAELPGRWRTQRATSGPWTTQAAAAARAACDREMQERAASEWWHVHGLLT